MRAMFLWSVVICAMFAVNAFAQTGVQYAILTDSTGNIVGQLSGDGITPVDSLSCSVPVFTRTSAPTGVTMSTLAPAFTSTPTTVKVTVSKN